jgi:diaminohydroxyphosphoribosylaminopyrimidine deaminase/5-amino-6-(5-phosphoribosylamino)uracil reductase
VILTASASLPEQRLLRATAREIPVLVFTASGNEAHLAGWAADGCEVVGLPATGGRLSADAVLAELGRRRMTNVLVEGGAGVLGSFLDGRAADELHAFIAPKLVGGDAAVSPVGGCGVGRIADALGVVGWEVQRVGDDIYVRGRVSQHEVGGDVG